MFRWDKVTVKREIYEIKEGEAEYTEPVTVLEDIPCHLSISLTNTTQINGAPYLLSEYTLFLNFDPDIQIKENDILLIETSKGQKYRLYAGGIKIYNLTIQIRCREEKNIEG